LNYDNLSVGRTEGRGQGQRPSTAEDNEQ
jgi:hypothetical protein